MAPRKRSTAAANISQPAIHQVTSALESLPEKPKESWSLREAINQLQEPITIALARGYSYEEVTQLLADNGIAISVFSLKRYLSLSKSQKEGAVPSKRGRGRKRAVDTSQTDETVTAQTDETAIADAPEEVPTPAESTPRRRRKSAKAESSEQSQSAAKTKATTRTRATTRTGATRGRKKAAS